MKTIVRISDLNSKESETKTVTIDVDTVHGKKTISTAVLFCDKVGVLDGQTGFMVFLHHEAVPGNSGFIIAQEIRDLRAEPEYDGLKFEPKKQTKEEKKAKRKERRAAKKAVLTDLEKDVIEHGFGNNEYENDGNPVWTWSIQPNCRVVTKEQISGVIGSLVKKGLAISVEAGADSTVELTEKGKEYLKNTRKDN